MDSLRLNALPAKRFFKNAAQQYTTDLALFELIDNSIDNWRENGEAGALEIHVRFLGNSGVYTALDYHDNAGGVPPHRLEALVQLGSPNLNEDPIGSWGAGLKMATLSLAETTVFWTRYLDSTPYRIVLDDEWWDSREWFVDATPEEKEALAPGSFRLQLTGLRRPLTSDDVFGADGAMENSLAARVRRVYTPVLATKEKPGVVIIFEAEGRAPRKLTRRRFGDPDRFAEVFAYPPGFEPTKHVQKFGDVTVEAVVGLLPEQSRDRSGVTMYGKGRMFAFALKEGAVGFGTRGKAKIPASHPTTWRLVILAYFSGPSDKIPWGKIAKWTYDENNEHAKDLHAFFQDAAEPYAAFTRAAKRLDILPYSERWKGFDEAQRVKEIRSYAGDKADPQLFFEAVPALRGEWAPTPIPVVNHDQPASLQPRDVRPALSLATARSIAAVLKTRDPMDASRLWGGPKSMEIVPAVTQRVISAVSRRATIDDEWVAEFRTTVAIPLALRRHIENLTGGGSLSEWIRVAAEERAAQTDAVWRIPDRPGHHYRGLANYVREQILAKEPKALAIGLFGSVARGEAKRDSDVDFLVVHEDRPRVQQVLNDAFVGFTYPPYSEERYTISIQVSSPGVLESHVKKGDKEFRKMLSDIIWIMTAPNFEPPKVSS